jgi:hypothetical protein
VSIPNPVIEYEKDIKSGREAYVEMLLASLIVGTRPPKMNKPFSPSQMGIRILQEIDAKSFGILQWTEDPKFVWELCLVKRPQDQENRWPDLAVLWPNRILLLELKVERGSIRKEQVEDYIDLAQYHYPSRQIDLILITTDPVERVPRIPENARYKNLTWKEVAQIIETEMKLKEFGVDSREKAAALFFYEYLSNLKAKTPRSKKPPMTKYVEIKPESLDEKALSAIRSLAQSRAFGLRGPHFVDKNTEIISQYISINQRATIPIEVRDPKSGKVRCAWRINHDHGGFWFDWKKKKE